jgi:hypothetical protein
MDEAIRLVLETEGTKFELGTQEMLSNALAYKEQWRWIVKQ